MDTRQTLDLVHRQSGALADDLRRLPEADWKAETCCTGWDVKMVAAHVTVSGPNYCASVERGLAGDLGPLWRSPEERANTIRAEASKEPAAVVADLEAGARRFHELFSSLSPDQLETPASHSYGPRPAHWFVQQRLAEVAVHRWDIRSATGLGEGFDDGVARVLLPMIVEGNMPATYARQGPKEVRGSFTLSVRGEPALVWTLRVADGVATASPGEGGEAVIDGNPSALALLLYGRRSVEALRAAGEVELAGDVGLAARFKKVFPGP